MVFFSFACCLSLSLSSCLPFTKETRKLTYLLRPLARESARGSCAVAVVAAGDDGDDDPIGRLSTCASPSAVSPPKKTKINGG